MSFDWHNATREQQEKRYTVCTDIHFGPKGAGKAVTQDLQQAARVSYRIYSDHYGLHWVCACSDRIKKIGLDSI